ncbi:protein transport protein Sec16A-like isoform X2 [Amphibalanus amphitrite]|uniref:protein transport protein Sec16A-like isoform X2 n=1 Tax=Amphibalanus amphitrite TaxID=1232801 RepID=UPI001C923492|nr:protein transport protein Sec16A-like isoform X2 [Amphibalanus amphitrite]
MKQGIWGHALFLASKMDQRTYGQVMTRFANGLLQNDPLQTLYQLMSGRQPSCTTSCADERWGDWRPHLAMILSNTTHRPELNQRAIVTLGDTLAARGLLHAAHFCYLMAQCEFGPYERKSSKLVLIGSAHQLPWSQFATNEAIQRTEVFEYAQSLGAADYVLTHLQAMKFIYATRLAEVGLITECLHYCEVIGGLIAKYPSSFNYSLVSRVYALGSQLKYHDAHYQSGEGELSEMGDPEWLLALQNVLVEMQNGRIPAYPQPTDAAAVAGGGAEPAELVADPAAAEQLQLQHQEQHQFQEQHQPQPEYGVTPQQPPAEPQAAAAGGTYDPAQYLQQQADPSASAAAPYDPAAFQQSQPFVPVDQTDGGGGADYWGGWGYANTPAAPTPGQDNGTEGGMEATQPGQTDTSPPPSAADDKNFNYWDQPRKMTDHNLSNLAKRSSTSSVRPPANQRARAAAASNRRTPAAGRQPISSAVSAAQPISGLDTPTGAGGNQLRHRVNARRTAASAPQTSHTTTSTSRRSNLRREPTHQDTARPETSSGRQAKLECRPAPLGDGTVRTYPIDEPCCAPPHLCREHARLAPATGDGRADSVGEDSESEASSVPSENESEPAKGSAPPPTTSASQSASGAPSNDQSGGGWFGGLFSRLGKPKNQMKLPDDKDKSIVYDPATKRWVDKDAGPDDGPQAPAAPPSDSQLLGGGGGGGPPAMGGGAPPGGPPPPPAAGGGNKFKIPKGRGMRSNYVDVFGGSGSASGPGGGSGPSAGPASLPPLVPSPGPIPPADGSGMDAQPPAPGDGAPPQGAAPPMFNPGQMAGAPAPVSAPRGRLNRYGRR